MTNAADPQATAVARPDQAQAATRVLTIIRHLSLELHPEWRKTLIVVAESELDRDLGYDSLSRAELLLRLNRDFGIRLADQLIVDAATAGDICDAVIRAAPEARLPQARTEIRPILLPESEAPENAATLLDALTAHVEAEPDRPHVLLWHSEDHEERLSYGELDRAARAVGHGLVEAGVQPGDRVSIMLPTSIGFFHVFFGVLMAGGIPVPVYPPLRRAQVEDHLRRQARILRNAEVVALVTDESTRQIGALLHGLVESLRIICTVDDLVSSSQRLEAPLPAAPSETALIQYTSGSTGDPKGVVLTHANLLANIRAMGSVMEAESSDVFVSWLPLYHDMGLIGAWLGSLYYGVTAIIMSPLTFIADPVRWLWAIHRHRATLSAAPNFAFELCLKRIDDADIEGLDLTSLRMVVNGAEPVSPSTIARFSERFGKHGFAPETMAPVYGLAECSVGLAFPPTGRRPIIDRVERRTLVERGVAEPVGRDDPSAMEFVACGQPLPGHQIRIIDDTGHEAPERQQGRLEFRGPSATTGYFRNPEKTAALLNGDWLDSGDLAYIAEGDIYLTGRIKDIIIRAGRNVYPHELEECIGDVEGIRKGCVAAFAGTDETTGTERLIVVAETRLTEATAQANLSKRVLDASTTILEIPPDDIALVPPHAVPKTSSGKIRRSATRELYEAGALGGSDRPLWWQLGRLTLSGTASRIRRRARTAGEFIYAGWWWTVLVAMAFGVWPLVLILPRRRWRHALIGASIRSLFRLTGIAFTVDQVGEPVPERDVIIVVNHGSYLDGAVLTAAVGGPLTFVVTERFGRQFVAGRFLGRLGTVFVGDATAGLRGAEDESLRAVRDGERLVVFPEGRLRRMPGLLSFYPGPFLIAAEAGVPIVPITLTGTRSVLRDGGHWFPRRGSITVRIGRPVRADGNDFAAALRLSRRIRDEILAHSREPDLGHEEINFGLPD